MKYSLVLHANGPKPSDFAIYINDSDSVHTKPNVWYRVGRVQNIRFVANAGQYVPEMSSSFLGVSLRACEEPDLSSGVNILVQNFAVLQDTDDKEHVNVPNIGSVLVRTGDIPLGCIQHIEFEADVKGNAKLFIRGVKSKLFDQRLMEACDWNDRLPSWVFVAKEDLDNSDKCKLEEVGTDGVIDSISEHARKGELPESK